MKINDIIDSINTIIKDKNKGFFILYKNRIKELGNYYTYEYILYLHVDGENTPYLTVKTTEQVKNEEYKEAEEKVDKLFLTTLLTKIIKI